MSEVNKAPLLVVAGVRNEKSLGWSAAQAWLDRDPNNEVLVTARDGKSQDYVQSQKTETNGRVDLVAPIDWTEADAARSLYEHLTKVMGSDRRVAGAVHSIAWAPPENFTTPAHGLPTDVYRQAMDATALSYLELIRGTEANMAPNAGVVTYGFGEHEQVFTEYGPALSTAKDALAHLVKETAVSLGRKEPAARTAEIVTWFIPTYAGRGVLAGIGQQRGRRVKPQQVEEHTAANMAALTTASPDEQWRNAGMIAADFIGNPMWSQTTGQRFEVNAGVPLIGPKIVPEENDGK